MSDSSSSSDNYARLPTPQETVRSVERFSRDRLFRHNVLIALLKGVTKDWGALGEFITILEVVMNAAQARRSQLGPAAKPTGPVKLLPLMKIPAPARTRQVLLKSDDDQ
jgi:hypothetical protein